MHEYVNMMIKFFHVILIYGVITHVMYIFVDDRRTLEALSYCIYVEVIADTLIDKGQFGAKKSIYEYYNPLNNKKEVLLKIKTKYLSAK